MNFCSEKQVKDVFDAIFDEEIVDKVVTVEKNDLYTHKKSYKMFFIHFAKTNNRLDHFIGQIKENTFQQVIYDKSGHFWKVIIAESKKITSFLPPVVAKMESTVSGVNILFIKYAKHDCTEEQVHLYFKAILQEDLIEKIVTLTKTDYKTETPFKMFFIHFKSTNGYFEEIVRIINIYRYYKIFLDADEKFFWKLQIPDKKEEEKPFVPAVIEVPDAPKAAGWDEVVVEPTSWGDEDINFGEPDNVTGNIADIDHGTSRAEKLGLTLDELAIRDFAAFNSSPDSEGFEMQKPLMQRTISVSDEEMSIINSKKDIGQHTVCDIILEGSVLDDIMAKISLEPRLEDIFEPRPVKLQRSKTESASPAKKQKVKKG